MSDSSSFLQEIVKVAVEIASPTIDQFCNDLDKLPPGYGQENLANLIENIVQPEVRGALSKLVSDWRLHADDVSPRELAWALRAANSMDAFHRLRQRLELVWSGPLCETSTFRRTDQALLEIIEAAKRSIIIVAFAAYRVPQIAAALVNAASRGIKVILILESTEDSDGAVTFSAITSMGKELARAATVYAWPMDKRDVDGKGNRGALHAKCAVVDDEAALISSANLTEHAMQLNMEVGLVVSGGDLPGSLAGHLQSLIQSGVLVSCKVE